MNDITIDKTGWKKYRFGDVAIQTKEIVDMDNTELTRYVAGEHMNSEDIHIRKWGTVGDGYLGPAFIRRFHKGDILYGSRRTYLKKVAIADFDGITANTTFVIKPKEELIEPVLLVHLMLSKSFTEYSVTNSRGSVNPYINWKDIADYEFLLPPKPEQKRIAALLWSADEMIEKEKIKLGRLEKYFEAYLYYGFEKSNFNADLHSCINELIGGGTPNTKNEEYYCDFKGVPWVTSISLESIYINKGERHITQLGINQSATNILSEGNIILGTRVGVGKCSINNVAMCFSQDSTGLIIKKEIVDPVFLLFTLRSLYSQKYFKSHSRGTTIQGITKEDLLKLPVWIPNMNQQLSIAENCTNMVNSIEKSQKLLEQSQQIKLELINKVY